MTKRSGFKMRSGNRSSFKMMGSSPTKNTGIFDSKGNRISMDQATTLEGKGEKVMYTEGDAIKKAESEKKKTTTTQTCALTAHAVRRHATCTAHAVCRHATCTAHAVCRHAACTAHAVCR